ncbi:HEPN domain-containing protein [Gluconobacter sp. OJB]|uniref:HEPN domain-containing protein n=1 Tax=Gluconobacter sp. OJB TaxID=3145196 RepID=UPI0031F75CBF
MRERLYDIISNFDFLDRETASSIILDIVDIRNEIMHYGGIKNNNSRFSDSIIIKFIGILEMLSVISVMFVSGVEKEIIKKIYMESSFYYYPRNLYEGYKRNKV